MWQRMESCGLIGRKLAVFETNDADEIATQVCRDLGIIPEQSHTDKVAEWIANAQRLEPIQKRLRGDVGQDSLHVSFLSSRSAVLDSGASSVFRVAFPREEFHDERPPRRRVRLEGEDGARFRRKTIKRSIGRGSSTKSYAASTLRPWKILSIVWNRDICIWH